MKTYRRIQETPHGFIRETTVTSDGQYLARCVWDDGLVTELHCTTLKAMGWPSCRAFLNGRKGFEEVPA